MGAVASRLLVHQHNQQVLVMSHMGSNEKGGIQDDS